MSHYALVSGLILSTVLALANAATAQNDRHLTGSVPAASLKSVEVRGKVGSIRLIPNAASDIQYSVRLTAKTQWRFFGGRQTGRPELLQLREDRRADALTLDLSGDRENVEEEWTIEVPASFAARLTLDVGKVHVRGIRGGCDVRVDVGDIDVDVPEGAVVATSDVGDISVNSGTSSYGNVDLRSDVGRVSMMLDGHQMERKRAPGAGDSFRLTGPGRDAIRARTDVGDVQVRIRR
jgi:hypothetical protein